MGGKKRRPVIYAAQPMSGRRWADVVKEARKAKKVFEAHGLEVWSPALHELTEETDERGSIQTGLHSLRAHWEADKKALAKCDALVSLRGDLASEGVGLEIGMATFRHRIPVVVISELAVGRVTHIEATAVVRSVRAAARFLRDTL